MTIIKKAIKCAGLVITAGTVVYGVTKVVASHTQTKTRADRLVALAGSKGLSKKHVNLAGRDAFATITQLATIATVAIDLADRIAQATAKDATDKAAELKKVAPQFSAEAKTLIDAKEKRVLAHADKTKKLARQVVKASSLGSKNAKKKVDALKKDAIKTTKTTVKRVNKNL